MYKEKSISVLTFLILLLSFDLLSLCPIFPSDVSLEILKFENIFTDLCFSFRKNYWLKEWYHRHLNVIH